MAALLLSFALLMGAKILDLQKLGYEQYQDIIVNGEIHQKANYGHEDCDKRYQIIRSFLDNYKRPFTMLDLGASQGYYSLRAARDFEGCFVMLDGNNPSYPKTGDQLQSICRANTNLDNIILLKTPIRLIDMQVLSVSEHFDVTLALNILHWFPQNWQQMAEAFLAMGDYLIVESPPPSKGVGKEQNRIRKSIHDFLMGKGAEIIGEVPRHRTNQTSNIYLLSPKKRFLEKRHFIARPLKGRAHEVISNFSSKKLLKTGKWLNGKDIETDWIPGINLVTYKMLRGAHPAKAKLLSFLEDLREVPQNDWMISNMILDGRSLHFIDINDPNHAGGYYRFSEAQYQRHRTAIQIDDPQKFKEFFWQRLAKKK